VAAPSASEPTIDEEVKLMNAAQAALRAGEPKRALELLNEHAARFPAGKLSTARQVTHMMALCQAGKAEQARHEATSFLAKNPGSPFAARVSGICASNQ
jgi:outer membrane protein assembly factor BamD (BamD/ComL family)